MPTTMVSWMRAVCNSCEVRSDPLAIDYRWEDEPWSELTEDEILVLQEAGWDANADGSKVYCPLCRTAVGDGDGKRADE